MQIYYTISEYCNMKCKYCYLPQDSRSKRDGLIESIVESRQDKIVKNTQVFVDKIKKKKLGNIGQIALHGAETFVYSPETVGKIYKMLLSTGVDVIVQTNGLALTKDYVDRMDIDGFKDRTIFSFSLDTPSAHNEYRDGSFDVVSSNMQRMKSEGFNVQYLSCITKKSIDELDEFVKTFKDFKSSFKIVSHFDIFTPEESKAVYDVLKENGLESNIIGLDGDRCINNGNNCEFYEFTWDGKMYACNKDFRRTKPFANWVKDSIKSIRKKRVGFFKNAKISDECKSCEFFDICLSGCPLDRHDGKAIDCEIRKLFFADNNKGGD